MAQGGRGDGKTVLHSGKICSKYDVIHNKKTFKSFILLFLIQIFTLHNKTKTHNTKTLTINYESLLLPLFTPPLAHIIISLSIIMHDSAQVLSFSLSLIYFEC